VFFNRDSAETDRNCLGRNSHPQFYVVVAMPLFHSILATVNRIENSVYILLWLSAPFVLRDPMPQGSMSNATFTEGSAAAKRLKNTAVAICTMRWSRHSRCGALSPSVNIDCLISQKAVSTAITFYANDFAVFIICCKIASFQFPITQSKTQQDVALTAKPSTNQPQQIFQKA